MLISKAMLLYTVNTNEKVNIDIYVSTHKKLTFMFISTPLERLPMSNYQKKLTIVDLIELKYCNL